MKSFDLIRLTQSIKGTAQALAVAVTAVLASTTAALACDETTPIDMRAIYLDGTPVNAIQVEPGRPFRIHVAYHECLDFAVQPMIESPSITGTQFPFHLRPIDPGLADPRFIKPDPVWSPPETIADTLVTDPLVMVWEDEVGVSRAGPVIMTLPEIIR